MNLCTGGKGDSFAVKINNECNGSCKFCISRNEIIKTSIPVGELIAKINTVNVSSVLIVGGEPGLYPELLKLVSGIKNKDIFLTSNGTVMKHKDINKIIPYLKCLNMSIHHPNLDVNKSITGVGIIYADLRIMVKVCKENNVRFRINSNLICGGIDNVRAVKDMENMALDLGVDTLRFSELHNSPELFINAWSLFSSINKNPFLDGCEQIIKRKENTEIVIRQTCGRINKCKDFVIFTPYNPYKYLVMYPDGSIYDDWQYSKMKEVKE